MYFNDSKRENYAVAALSTIHKIKCQVNTRTANNIEMYLSKITIECKEIIY